MAFNPDDMALDPELVELAAGGKKKEEKKVELSEADLVPEAEPKKEEPRVMCFVSRREYPMSETVELKYKNQNVRVAKSFVKFAQ